MDFSLFVDFIDAQIEEGSIYDPTEDNTFGIKLLDIKGTDNTHVRNVILTCPICHRRYHKRSEATECLERCRNVKSKFNKGDRVWAPIDNTTFPGFIVGVCDEDIVQVCVIDTKRSGELIGPIIFRSDTLTVR